MIPIQQTTSNYDKDLPFLQVVGNTIYYIWVEKDASAVLQIWTATSNLDGSSFVPTKQTNVSGYKYEPMLQVSGSTIYYSWYQDDGNFQLWMATSSLNGTSFTPVKLTTGSPDKNRFTFKVYGNSIYYLWHQTATGYQIYTGISDLDGSNFAATKQTTSAYNKDYPQFDIIDDIIYYIWSEIDGAFYQIWTATSNLDGSSFTATKQTTSTYTKYEPKLKILSNKIYYVWKQFFSPYYQIWTANSNLDGTGFTAVEQTTSSYTKNSISLGIIGSMISYLWSENDGSAYQIWTATSNLNGTNFTPVKETTSSDTKFSPNFSIINSKMYYIWLEHNGTYHQIWTWNKLMPGLPTVQTLTPNGKINSALLRGKVISSGISDLLRCGFKLDTNANPTTDYRTDVSSGFFSLKVPELNSGTDYYVCAYAESDFLIGYGDIVQFTTGKWSRNPMPLLNMSWDRKLSAPLGSGINWFRLDESTLDGGFLLTSESYSEAEQIIDVIGNWDTFRFEDESTRIISIEGLMEMSGDNNQAITSEADVVLDNTDGRFTPKINKNLLLNPSFEYADIENWTITSGLGTYALSSTVVSGIQSLELRYV